MRLTNKKSELKTKFVNFIRNYEILLSVLTVNSIKGFLKAYIHVLVKDNEIYINKLLLNCNLIDISTFNKLEVGNYSILELALATEFELSKDLHLTYRKAFIIKIIAQFHYSNLFSGFTIYYAHSISNYDDFIENKEIKIIKIYFPFAEVINPSKLNSEWKKQNYSRSKIMAQCLNIVSGVDLLIFAPFNEFFISKGVFEEITTANNLNIPLYLLHNKKLHNYTLGEKKENDWRKYCTYIPFSLIHEELIRHTSSDEISLFFKANQKLVEKNIISDGKKYIIICNTTKQSAIVINKLLKIFNGWKPNILPIIGKKSLCDSEHDNNNICKSSQKIGKHPLPVFFPLFNINVQSSSSLRLKEAIKESTPQNCCPYLILYEHVGQADIIVINKIFFKSVRLRTKLRKEIIYDDPYKFILIFDRIKDLFDEHIESRCSNEDLNEALIVLRKKDNIVYNKASAIIQSLLETEEGDTMDVDIYLREFLVARYQKRRENINLLEKIFEICKTPFGKWIRQGNEIVQIIGSKSLNNFLNYFFQVYHLKHGINWTFRGE